MLKLQDYIAWISVDGQPLDTYAVETSMVTNEVTCWIPSEAGKVRHLGVVSSFYV
jgi:hypothetical protein